MTPINEVPVGKFVRFEYAIAYMCYNNFKDRYTLLPIGDCIIPRDKSWTHKVYIYKRIKKEWIKKAKEILKTYLGWQAGGNMTIGIDNLTYIENLAILKSYGI